MTLTDFASGIGGLDQAKGAALEQVIIDCDLWEQVREMRKDVPLDDARFVIDLIRDVGPGGTFLKVPHTARNMRKEMFLPAGDKADLFASYRLNKDQGEMVKRAKLRADKILGEHVPEPLDADSKKKIDSILDRYAT
jgi:trimethylamine--corrinoid protein Co-methyltransferase